MFYSEDIKSGNLFVEIKVSLTKEVKKDGPVTNVMKEMNIQNVINQYMSESQNKIIDDEIESNICVVTTPTDTPEATPETTPEVTPEAKEQAAKEEAAKKEKEIIKNLVKKSVKEGIDKIIEEAEKQKKVVTTQNYSPLLVHIAFINHNYAAIIDEDNKILIYNFKKKVVEYSIENDNIENGADISAIAFDQKTNLLIVETQKFIESEKMTSFNVQAFEIIFLRMKGQIQSIKYQSISFKTADYEINSLNFISLEKFPKKVFVLANTYSHLDNKVVLLEIDNQNKAILINSNDRNFGGLDGMSRKVSMGVLENQVLICSESGMIQIVAYQ